VTGREFRDRFVWDVALQVVVLGVAWWVRSL
jgi:hypothetical protein